MSDHPEPHIDVVLVAIDLDAAQGAHAVEVLSRVITSFALEGIGTRLQVDQTECTCEDADEEPEVTP